jgi:hypothetical protein
MPWKQKLAASTSQEWGSLARPRLADGVQGKDKSQSAGLPLDVCI